MHIYLCGPMSGHPGFNVLAFDQAAVALRAKGHTVISPAEMDGPETRAAIVSSKQGAHTDLPAGESWGFYLSRDLRYLFEDGIEAVVCLPGWEKSRGARLETFACSRILGLPVYLYDKKLLPFLERIGDVELADAWLGDLEVFIEPYSAYEPRPALFDMRWKGRVGMPRVPRSDE